MLGMPSHTKPHEYEHAIKLFNDNREDEFIDYIYELNEKSESIKDSSFDSSIDLKRAVQSQIKLRERIIEKKKKADILKQHIEVDQQSSIPRSISQINIPLRKL